ncbi:hypothetical protein [Lacihabitans sp. CCS-44]|uniref:hypothetical protein n=1 Tax=Lacihabitans sp. CCS-44 TaxID=2487331 RepID=UPI0020CD9198|nr:hypothetical protein [Lacihabitans sp. CCS-44]
MKKTFITFIISLLFIQAFAQNAKVIDSPTGTVISNAGGTDIPYSASILDIRSSNKGVLLPRMSTVSRDAIGSPQAGLLLFNSTTNQFDFHNGTSWQQLYLGNQWGINGPTLHHNGSVGVGITSMLNSSTFLTVRGNLGGTNYEGMYIDASSSTGKPFYGYATGGLSKAFHYFDGSNNKWHLYNSGDRLTVTSNGEVGIGIVSPGYKLEVNGDAQINTNLWVNGTFDVDGTSDFASSVNMQNNLTIGNNLTVSSNILVNGNKGIVRSSSGTQQKVVRTTGGFGVTNLSVGGFVDSGNLNYENFGGIPTVTVGQVNNATATGEWYKILIIPINVTATECQLRIVNLASDTVTFTGTWNFLIVGPE